MSLIPPRYRRASFFKRQSHGSLHETPHEQRKYQNEPQSLDALWRLKEETVDDDSVFEESKIALHVSLILVSEQEISRAYLVRPTRQGVGQKHETAGLVLRTRYSGLISADLDAEVVRYRCNLPSPISFGFSPGVSDLFTDLSNQSRVLAPGQP